MQLPCHADRRARDPTRRAHCWPVAGASGACAHAGRCLDDGLYHLGVLAHTEVVVRAPDYHWTGPIRGTRYCMREAPGDPLKISKHAVTLFLVQAAKCSGEEMIVGHQRNPCPVCARVFELVIGWDQAASASMPAEGCRSLGGRDWLPGRARVSGAERSRCLIND